MEDDYLTLDEFLVCLRESYLRVYYRDDHDKAGTEKWHPADLAHHLGNIMDGAIAFWDMRLHIRKYPNDHGESEVPNVETTAFTLENSDEVLIGVHPSSACKGQNCTLHNLSDHHMRSWPQHWRSDRAVMERICEHGVGHPDPDDYHFQGPKGVYEAVHGCDGCCVEPEPQPTV